MREILLSIVAIMLFVSLSHARNVLPPDAVLNPRCKPTPMIFFKNFGPIEPVHSNNLARKAGATEEASGEKIIIYGRILDVNCVPVSDAVVDLWQANAQGMYQFANSKEERVKIEDSPYYDHNFSGSGKATSNNMGGFTFVTIKPGAKASDVPHIRVRIRHKDFDEFETKIFLDDIGFAGDKEVSKLSMADKEALLASTKISDFGRNYYDILPPLETVDFSAADRNFNVDSQYIQRVAERKAQEELKNIENKPIGNQPKVYFIFLTLDKPDKYRRY